jgi:hypothetical protein
MTELKRGDIMPQAKIDEHLQVMRPAHQLRVAWLENGNIVYLGRANSQGERKYGVMLTASRFDTLAEAVAFGNSEEARITVNGGRLEVRR